MEREDTPLYPMEALREALANAVCHRDYGLRGSSIGLAVYDDRLEITNTGTLPSGITLEELVGVFFLQMVMTTLDPIDR